MLLEMGPIIYACCTDHVEEKLCIAPPRMLAAIYIPCQRLSTGELFAICREKGREGTKCQRKHVLKALVLYNRMFSSRCLFVLIY